MNCAGPGYPRPGAVAQGRTDASAELVTRWFWVARRCWVINTCGTDEQRYLMPFRVGITATLSMHSARLEYAVGWLSSRHPSAPEHIVITTTKMLFIAHIPFRQITARDSGCVAILRGGDGRRQWRFSAFRREYDAFGFFVN
jgi:hypothetical protein